MRMHLTQISLTTALAMSAAMFSPLTPQAQSLAHQQSGQTIQEKPAQEQTAQMRAKLTHPPAGRTGLYMNHGTDTIYKVVIKSDARKTKDIIPLKAADIAPEDLEFLFATSSGSVSGNFKPHGQPQGHVECDADKCIISFKRAVQN